MKDMGTKFLLGENIYFGVERRYGPSVVRIAKYKRRVSSINPQQSVVIPSAGGLTLTKRQFQQLITDGPQLIAAMDAVQHPEASTSKSSHRIKQTRVASCRRAAMRRQISSPIIISNPEGPKLHDNDVSMVSAPPAAETSTEPVSDEPAEMPAAPASGDPAESPTAPVSAEPKPVKLTLKRQNCFSVLHKTNITDSTPRQRKTKKTTPEVKIEHESMDIKPLVNSL